MYTNGYILIQNAYKYMHIDTKWILMDTYGYKMDTKWIHQCINLKVQTVLELPSLYYCQSHKGSWLDAIHELI